jgi:hypothetical protein
MRFSAQIKVFSDHRNLSFFASSHPLRPRHARWNLLLSDFDFEICYISGTENAVADALSRQDGALGDKDQVLTLLPPELWQRVAATVFVPTFNTEVDCDTDWPLIIAHFLARDVWPSNLEPSVLTKCQRETENFRLLDSDDLRFVRITPHGPVPYLAAAQRLRKVREYHEALGHMAADSIVELLERRVWWPGMQQYVTEVTRQCRICQLFRSDSSSTHPAPIRPIPPVALPFQRWGIDFVGPLPESRTGKKYILTAIDYATRWVVAEAVSDCSAKTVMQFLYHKIVMEFGPPYELISDRAKSFLEDAMPSYARFLRIQHLPSTSYHPRTNGMVERMHATLNHGIRTMASDRMDRWDEFLPQVVFAIRVRKHAVTKFSPFYLLFGVHPRLPFDTSPPREILQPLDDIERMEEREEFFARQLDDLGEARRAAYTRSKAQAEAMIRRNNLPQENSTNHRFKVGDWVKLKIVKRTKWQQHWAGPFTVVKLYFPHTYFLMSMRGHWLNVPVNEERLALWIGNTDEPDMVDPNVEEVRNTLSDILATEGMGEDEEGV